MRVQFLRNSFKCLSHRDVINRQSNLRTWSLSSYQINAYSTARSPSANKLQKDKVTLNQLPLSAKYLNYSYVATSKYRWIEFEGGCIFDVGLFDSFENKEFDERVPVIVGVPGCVGTHEDLIPYLSTFVRLGYRVIIPNLPGTKYCKGRTKTEEHVFTMSANEKAEFIKDVLDTIQVPKVDILVVHSDSVYAGLELVASPLFKSKNIKSIALLDPTGLQYTSAMEPVWIYKKLSYLIENHSQFTAIKKLLINVFKIFSEKRSWKVDDIMIYSRNIGAISFKEANLNAQRFTHSPLPLCVFYGNVGNTIDIPSTDELLEVLGVQKSNTTICDENCQITSKGAVGDNQRCFFFTDGHTSEEKMIFIRTELLKFLKSVRPDILEL